MKKLFSVFAMLFVISSVYLPITFGQEATTLRLPKGAKARLGKGMVYSHIAHTRARGTDAVYNHLAYSSDGVHLAVRSNIGIWIYDARTGVAVNLITGGKNFVFSPDGQTLASNSGGTTIRLWDVDTGKQLHTLTAHENSVYDMFVNKMVFSPDGQTLASGSEDGTVLLWKHVK